MAGLTTTSNQIEIEDCEIRATLLSDSFEKSSSINHQLVLHCPACAADTFLGDRYCQDCGSEQPAFAENRRISFDVLTQFVAFRKKKFALISGAVFISFAAFALFASIGLSLPDQLDKSLKANRLNDAARLAEKLYVSRFGVLSGRDAELYSEVFHKRAQVFAGNQNYKLALCDLSKVLPQYSQSAEVAQLGSIYRLSLTGGGVISSTKNDLTANAANGNHKRPTQAQAVSNGSNSVVRDSGKAPAGKLPPGSPDSKTEAVSDQYKDEINSDREVADMAAYNRHLADYFTAVKGGDTAVKDPPSFNEWVQAGKTDF